MMTVEIVKRMKVKKIYLDKADVVKREVSSINLTRNALCVGLTCSRWYTHWHY